MDETTVSIIKRIRKEFSKPTEFTKGKLGTIFFDCVHLTPSELARLAAEAVGDLDHDSFDLAIGLAYNGIFFASAIAGGRQAGICKADGAIWGPEVSGKKVILVDDVIHTGARLVGIAEQLKKLNAEVIGFACIVDRTDNDSAIKKTKLPIWSAYQACME